ncbi:MAG: preprotein translocase subunit SecA [Alphaproteobacteria bacterium]
MFVFKLASKIFGSSNERIVKSLSKHVEPINALEPYYEAMSNTELQAQTSVLREKLKNGATEDDIMHDAFAVVREAAKRTLGQRHYDVQLIGGAALHMGKISEMKTGEGKTLVSTLAAYLNALSGKGVHIVTVNDYLAKRDSEWMGEIYGFLGLTTGCITGGSNEDDRRKAYACDITYATNNELGFDYLRDNMKFTLPQMVQRGSFNFAIIDEVDSILIDEARTPLIISGPSESATDSYILVNKLIPLLKEEDYEQDEKHKTIVLTDIGNEHVEELLNEHNLLAEGSMYDIQNIAMVHHVNQALRAHKLFHIDKDYIVKDGRVILIDEFTGRMMEGRRLSEGLHQAIEAKEGVAIQTENQTLASITFQNYFRLYPKLAGMTGTGMTEASEFQEIYNLDVVSIPTHVPVARIDYDDKIYRSLAEKEQAIVELIKECQERKQPVLVGTVSIEKSEKLSARFKKEKITHNVLNARYHEQEAYIVAQAGRPGAVTIATNMAGRGTDIQLGGNSDMLMGSDYPPTPADKQIVKDAGGLFIIGTERHESRRIDNQLRGRAGRQGDPGASIFFLSVEDDLMRIFAGDKLEQLLNSRIGLQEGESLEHPLISKMLERAQTKVEGMHFEVRKNLLKFDDVMNSQRKAIYEQRREIMESSDLSELIKDMRDQVIEDMVNLSIPANSYSEQWDTDTLHTEVLRVFGLDLPVQSWAKEEGIGGDEILERLSTAIDKKFASKIANYSQDIWRKTKKAIMLQLLDQSWKEHLLSLDHLRQGINLRAFGQKDPLNEYKTEAFGMFEAMLDKLRETVTQTLSLVEISIDENQLALILPGVLGGGHPEPDELQETRNDPAFTGQGGGGSGSIFDPRGNGDNVAQMPSRTVKNTFDPNDPETWSKVPRNADCPCGSGKKFKHCHGNIKNVAAS